MTGDTYSTQEAADDATEYAIAKNILADDPTDEDAAETVRILERRYGAEFFSE